MPDSSLIPGLSWRTAAVTANANKTEYVYFGSTVGYTITGIKFIPSDTVAADNTDYRVITITANSQAIVAVDSRAASLNGWTAGTVKELTLASDTAAKVLARDIGSGDVVTIALTYAGAGKTLQGEILFFGYPNQVVSS
jgi:hypothetical protein